MLFNRRRLPGGFLNFQEVILCGILMMPVWTRQPEKTLLHTQQNRRRK